MAKAKEETPLMKQYNAIKAKYPDALLLFRVGDFYETFNEDAVKAANILGIVLTKRANGAASEMDLAGFPHHSLDTYLPKLVRAGMRVAICDQLEDPKLTKTIVKRGVTEVVTPGVTFSEKLLDNKTNNFLAAVHYDEELCGVAFVDASTGEFFAGQGNFSFIDKVLQQYNPSEIVFQKRRSREFFERYGKKYFTFQLEEWVFQQQYATEVLTKQFKSTSLKGFGIEQLPLATVAAGAALHYLNETQQQNLQHITAIARLEEDKYVWLDKFTVRNLELISSPHERATKLIDVIDKTITPMGGRLLRRWVVMPLKDLQVIRHRQSTVQALVNNFSLSQELMAQLKSIHDFERLVSKAAMGKLAPREAVALRKSLQLIPVITQLANQYNDASITQLLSKLDECAVLTTMLENTLLPEPSVLIGKGGVIAANINTDLDELRHISSSGKEFLLEIQKRESERTQIPSLKVAFNNVFGYYIEVTHAHKNKVPPEWMRKQTLTNAERYITEELKVYEEKIMGAEEKILTLEEKIYTELVASILPHIQTIQRNAYIVAQLDCLLSMATLAVQNNYVKPQVDDSLIIDIKAGRHPVLELQMNPGEEYVANDVYLDSDTQQIIMITGPNMAGKSALLRQTALIVLLAQLGSYVPAQQARIGFVDKIFTRVGASDNISSGESTFMVEMNETASILNNVSNRSLILLDEIGRGTATYDGISIAWAIAEFLHNHAKSRAKTLFATHYHELNEMTNTHERIKNFNVSIKEAGNNILFLRKLVPGGIEHSFGIHVARMAGMPYAVIHRAQQMLEQLEQAHSDMNPIKQLKHKEKTDALQLSFFQLDDPVLQQIREQLISTDVNTLTPVEALLKLNEIKKMLGR